MSIQAKDNTIQIQFQNIIESAKNSFSKFNEDNVNKAFQFCLDIKANVESEYSVKFNIEIAQIVVNEIHLDEQSLIVAFIFDLYDFDTNFNLKKIRSEFGETVSIIIDGLNKIKAIEKESEIELEHLESFRKLLISLSTDVRILLFKLAMRLYTMRHLQSNELYHQKEIANETMEIYVPFANRFGLRNIKWQLEDLSFKFINPEAFYEIKNKLLNTRKEREDYASKFIQPVNKLLNSDPYIKSNDISFDVSSRAKHIYSIFNKMRARNKPLEELYDLIAMRIIVKYENPNSLFYVYGLVASLYQPIPETFKDYVSKPKKNGYRSLHFAVLGPQRKPVEVQIRTEQMHDFAEEGMAAHFNYKRGLLPVKSVFDEIHVGQWLDSVKDLFENRHNLSSDQLVDSLKKNLFFDEIHVFTPNNEMLIFPKDSSPLDFAYEIHSDLGMKCVGALVNGKEVPLDYKMHNGDQVEIITNDSHSPDKNDLNLVITPKAKSGINKYLKSIKKYKIDEGEKNWKLALKKHDLVINDMDFKKLYREMNFKEKEDFYLSLSERSEFVNKAIDFLKFKIDYGFSNIETNNRELVSKGLIYSFIIKGEKKQNIIFDILSMMVSIDVLNIESVQLEDYELKFEAKVTVKFIIEFDLRKLMNKIYEIKGVASVRLIK
ncbi:HD domain-containing protein [Candidatus Kapabacteria bacterium]|nr:HD domain-containing protein [Candidatus Kapabacteria bacterium]